MGGYGSGRRVFLDKKQIAEASPQVKISRLNLATGQQQVIVREKKVDLTWTNCNYGDQRPWFCCPLTYRSSQLSKVHRPLLQNDRLCRRLKGQGQVIMGQTIPPMKPKGMHYQSYERLCGKIEWNNCKRQLIVLREAQAMLRRR